MEGRRKILRCCNWRWSTKRLETSTSATKKMKIRCRENQFRRFRRTMKRPSSANCCCWMKSSPMKRGEVCWRRNCIADDATIRTDATTMTTSTTTTDVTAKSTTKSTATAVRSNRRNNSTGGDGSANADGDAMSGVAAASKRIAAPPETSSLVPVADRMVKSGKSTGC